jgi:beta-lactamase regulating signal transducer with metallopeptidase domain
VSWLLCNSVVALLLCVGVLALGKFAKPAPVVMHVLWLFVLLKLVTPPLFEVPLWEASSSAESHALEPTVSPQVGPLPAIAATGPILAQDVVAAAGSAHAPFSWTSLLGGIWLLGSLGMLLRLASGVRRARRRVDRLPPAPQWLQREVERLAMRMAVRTPILLDDACATSPCVWSLGTPRLVLPANVLATATRKGRMAVLAHELAHLRRGDHMVAHFELALAVVLWWHPLFWFARAQLRDWAELACDAWAVASVPAAAIEYATVLVDAVAEGDSAVPGMTVLAARPAARAAFERRLTMILTERVPCRVSRSWWLPFAALGVGLFAVPVAAQRQEPVHIDVKVNGKDLKELDATTRDALLKQLREAQKKDRVGKVQEPEAQPKKLKPVVRDNDDDRREVRAFEDAQDAMTKAMKEARAEIADDPDLRELGLTDDVNKLVEQALRGVDLQKTIDSMMDKAMKGATKKVITEIRGDADLRELGLTGDVEDLVARLMRGEDGDKAIDEMVRKLVGKGAVHFSSGGKSAHDAHSDSNSSSDSSHQESHQSDHQESRSDSRDAGKADRADGADAKDRSRSDAKSGSKATAGQKGKKKAGKRKQ